MPAVPVQQQEAAFAAPQAPPQAQPVGSPDFWRAFAPDLHVADTSFLARYDVLAMAEAQRVQIAALVREEGYLQANVADWGVDLARMAGVVRSLSDAGLSPVFAFVYDEFWVPFYRLHHIVSGVLGGKYLMLPDFWIWNVDPRKGDSGWKPHRDKDYRALFADGSPKSVTAWIPLSPATPLNGCMYVVPAMLDPTYGTVNDKDWKFEFPSIRALPAQPGDFFIWNQAVLHWGSRSSPRADASRVSMAFEFQRADVEPFNRPLIEPLNVLPFDRRLKLIAKQILQYRHMYRVDAHIQKFAEDLLA